MQTGQLGMLLWSEERPNKGVNKAIDFIRERVARQVLYVVMSQMLLQSFVLLVLDYSNFRIAVFGLLADFADFLHHFILHKVQNVR
jgi:hypothetical protein